MARKLTLGFAAACVAALFAGAVDASARGTTTGRGNGGGTPAAGTRPTYGSNRIRPPSGATDTDARGLVEAKDFPQTRRASARSWLKITTAKLDRGTYSVWIDDPSTTSDTSTADTGATFTTNRAGVGRVGWDTARGGSLPFSATLADLAGKTIEIQDTSGNVVLTGSIPRTR